MVLENKLGIQNAPELNEAEEKISKKRALELFESGKLNELEAGKFSSLKAIHKALFDDIYYFAGELRTVNISKGNFRFAPIMYLEAALENIDKMPQTTFDEIIEKYVEMNIAHPFREGNGRSTRIWLDCILKKELGKVVDWSQVDKEDYLLAMERSPIKDIEIKHILKNALTEKIDDREVYMKGIDHSYYYEGYTMQKVVMPIRIMAMLGAKKLILTNAAGGVNANFKAGDLMLITDHISSFVPSALIGKNIDELGVIGVAATDYGLRVDFWRSCLSHASSPSSLSGIILFTMSPTM